MGSGLGEALRPISFSSPSGLERRFREAQLEALTCSGPLSVQAELGPDPVPLPSPSATLSLVKLCVICRTSFHDCPWEDVLAFPLPSSLLLPCLPPWLLFRTESQAEPLPRLLRDLGTPWGWFPVGPIQADSCLGPQVDQLKLKVSRLEEECTLLRRARGPLPGAEDKEREPDGAELLSELRAENQRLTASLQELQEGLQQVGPWCWGCGSARSQPLLPTVLLEPEAERGLTSHLKL